MTIPTPEAANHPRRVPRWLPVLVVVVVAGVLIVLLAILLRRLGPQPEVWLRITPAASTVDEATAIALSSGGWGSGEQVAICLNKPDDAACDAESAVQIEIADTDGNLEGSVLAAAQLAEGRTIFLARGLESGRIADRSFRVLRASDASLASTGAAPDLTPIPGEQPSDVTSAAAGDIEAGEVATPIPAIDQFSDWRGEYFTNPDLTGEPALVRNDPDPNLNWGEGSPAPGVIPADGFSARWSRSMNFAPGVYRFVLTAQDGGRLLVEGQPVIDAWQGAEGQTVTADQALSGGQYQIVVHFRNLAGPASIAIGWSPLPTPTPFQVAGVDPTPTPDVAPTPPPTVTPDGSPTATPTNGPPTATPTLENGTPGATESVLPTSSVTASATLNGSATPEMTPGTPTATPDAPTATPEPVTTETPQTPPGSTMRLIEIRPTIGVPGQSIEVNSGNWSPGTVLQVSLGQFNTSYTQAERLGGVSYTTPIDSSQPWSFRFNYPTDPPWSNPTLPVYVWVHNADWSEWAWDVFDIERPE